MKESEQEQALIFFAYQSNRGKAVDENINAIKYAIENFNKHQKKYIIKSWEDYNKSGILIDYKILKAIEESEVFACDLTYLNHNVLFELGYAIGKKKKICIFFNEYKVEARNTYSSTIFSILTYQPFKNGNDILGALQKKTFSEDFFLSNNLNQIKKDFDLFYVESVTQTQSSINLTNIIETKKKDKIKIERDRGSEITYQTLQYYCEKINSSNACLIHLVPQDIQDSEKYNAKNSFLGGLSHGLDLKTAFIVQNGQSIPLDYNNLTIRYIDHSNCEKMASEWIDEISTTSLMDYEKSSDISKIVRKDEQKLNLLKLGVYSSIAEEEESLEKYFINTSSYSQALSLRPLMIFYGRKGSGKSAIYLRLLQNLKTNDSKTFIIGLSPEKAELEQDISFVSDITTINAMNSYFISIWLFLIYSRLILLVYDKIKELQCLDGIEKEIERFVQENKEMLFFSFSDMIRRVQKKHIQSFDNGLIAVTSDSMQYVYDDCIKPILKLLKEYLLKDRYFKIIILTYNLDRAWNLNIDLTIQSKMILALTDVRQRLESELFKNIKTEKKVSMIIFLRRDTYKYVLNKSGESDKFISNSYEINWDSYPNKLKELMENRFKYSLSIKDENIVQEVWYKYFQISRTVNNSTHPMDIVKGLLFSRPRDYVYFFNKMFEVAINRNHNVVMRSDFKYAKKIYAQFLRQNLLTELSPEFKDVSEILDFLFFNNKDIKYKEFRKKLQNKRYSEKDIEAIIDRLCFNDVIKLKEKNDEKELIEIHSERFYKKKNEKLFFFIDKYSFYLSVDQRYKLKEI